MVISIWIFARQFLENQLSLWLQGKQLTFICCQWKKIKALKWKSEFGKVVLVVLSLTASQYLKAFLVSLVILPNMIVLILCHKMCWCLEDLHNSVNWYFSDDQCMMLQNPVSVRDPFKYKPMDFSVTWNLSMWF